jgi:hypothetical protein
MQVEFAAMPLDDSDYSQNPPISRSGVLGRGRRGEMEYSQFEFGIQLYDFFLKSCSIGENYGSKAEYQH